MKYQNDPYKYEGQDVDPDEVSTPAPVYAPSPEKVMDEAALAEFDAAWKSAARIVTVQDEDGGTSQALRVPQGWSLDGCTNSGAFLLLRCPHLQAAKAASEEARAIARRAAQSFVDGEKTQTDQDRKARVKALPPEVRAELPRWLRKLA